MGISEQKMNHSLNIGGNRLLIDLLMNIIYIYIYILIIRI